ncbi:hypothetical protein SAMN04487910_2084 [Aquimarina amphilecti]|uniref:Uncharacterized protein n=1 Tax=Aquimarina amphilecti TaxID=1038014 RepID=A0A1H7NI74_AQUAM|nr:hypothetical protein [Aquimarina amphilecti]SEL22705.1 hypothetical protein SAMN04487910_2084 [Aquimarina amphilecti]
MKTKDTLRHNIINRVFKGTLIKLFTLFSFLLLTISCDTDNDPTNNICEDYYVNNFITTAFSNANNYDDLPEFMDLETHEYVIKINADGEICSVGYQNPSTYNGDYTIEVINTTSLNSYSGTHTFSQGQLDYQSITPVIVSSGDIITVKRTIMQGYPNLDATLGRVLRPSNFSTVPFPITQGTVEFLSSNFYGAGGPVNNIAMPYIGLGFKAD